MYSSIPETQAHIDMVSGYLNLVKIELGFRMEFHDQSKTESPELEIFDVYTPKLRGMTYGSDEYKACLEAMRPALEHHYKENRHHPEHFENGINGMNLIDLIEMICDWHAATKRHADGDIIRSIEQNMERFGYGKQLQDIFINTVRFLQTNA